MEMTLAFVVNSTSGNYAPENRWSSGQFDQLNVMSTLSRTLSSGAYVNGGVSFGVGGYRHERLAMGRPVSGAMSTESFGAQLEVGYETTNAVAPFVSYRYDHQTRFAFSEDDVTWGNHYKKETTYSSELALGLKFAKSYKPSIGETVLMTGLMSVAHDFAPERDFVASSLAAPGFYL